MTQGQGTDATPAPALPPSHLVPLRDGSATPPRVGFRDGTWWVQTCVDAQPFHFEGSLAQLLRMYATEGVTPDTDILAVATLAGRYRPARFRLTDAERATYRATGHVTIERLVEVGNSLVDGVRVSGDTWTRFMAEATAWWVDPGPSPAGNPGPYLKAPRPDEASVHRVYPRWSVGERVLYTLDMLSTVTHVVPILKTEAAGPRWWWVITLSVTPPNPPTTR